MAGKIIPVSSAGALPDAILRMSRKTTSRSKNVHPGSREFKRGKGTDRLQYVENKRSREDTWLATRDHDCQNNLFMRHPVAGLERLSR